MASALPNAAGYEWGTKWPCIGGGGGQFRRWAAIRAVSRRRIGQLYVKHGAYYGRWRSATGRSLNRRIGLVRAPGTSEGLTWTQAERQFRELQRSEDLRPTPPRDATAPTVDDAASSLRRRLQIEGARASYLENCESMQRVHISPRIGTRRLDCHALLESTTSPSRSTTLTKQSPITELFEFTLRGLLVRSGRLRLGRRVARITPKRARTNPCKRLRSHPVV